MLILEFLSQDTCPVSNRKNNLITVKQVSHYTELAWEVFKQDFYNYEWMSLKSCVNAFIVKNMLQNLHNFLIVWPYSFRKTSK